MSEQLHLVEGTTSAIEMMPRGLVEKFRQGSCAWRVTNDLVLRASGSDHLRYLHGRLTQDLKRAEISVPYQTLMLSSNGRLQGSFTFVRRSEDLILCAWGEIDRKERAISDLLQFKVADAIEVSADSYTRFSIWNANEDTLKVLATLDSIPGAFTLDESILDGRILHVLVPTERALSLVLPISNELLSADEVDAAELLCRFARFQVRFGVDVREQTIGAELPSERFVSFSKGCYAGQETIEMATARGKIPRVLGVFQVVDVDEENYHELSSLTAHGKVVGEFSSAVFIPEARSLYGFARVRSDSSVDGALSVSDARKVYPAHLVSHFVLP